MCIQKNDSIKSVYEDSKLDFEMLGDFLLMSSNSKTGRFNRKHGYEQFEYPSKIIYINQSNEIGLSYNPLFKTGNEINLSALNLNDGNVLWSAPLESKNYWNDVLGVNDSLICIASSGLHGVNSLRGVNWSYPMITAEKPKKPLIQTVFNPITLNRFFKPIKTSNTEGIVRQLASNILLVDGLSYFAATDKIISVDLSGKLIWETDLKDKNNSLSFLVDYSSNVLLLNLGLGLINGNYISYGKPSVMLFSKQFGQLIYLEELSQYGLLSDMQIFKNKLYFASRSDILYADNIGVKNQYHIDKIKYGEFTEFINGDEYFVEKEGFYVPLNFINDNVVYFKTDQDKVYGLNNDQIDYVYHFTELYKLKAEEGGKKIISQRNKSLLISENLELLSTLKAAENVIGMNNKFYVYNAGFLYIIDLNDVK